MPIYAYKCQACGHEMDKIQRLSDPVLTDCPECGESTLKKQITAASFKLTGTGWYETDFKDKKKDTDKNSTTSSDTSVKKDSPTKSDSGSSSKSDSSDKKSSKKSTSSKDAA